MSTTEVFLVVNPVQDYEESLDIWGVFGSLAAAKYATTDLRRKLLDRYEAHRDTEVQHWRGRDLLMIWTFSPDDPARWVVRVTSTPSTPNGASS